MKGKSELSSGNSPAGFLQERLACGVLVVDGRGRIAACTVEAAELLHAAVSQLENAPAQSLPHPLPELIRDAVKNGQPATHLEVALKEAPVGTPAIRTSILPMKARGETLVIVVLNHVEAAPIFAQNMRRLDRLASLGTLSASMAHEIKNGMVAIKTFIDLLLQRGQDTELTEVVDRELQRINAIVTQMLRFAAPRGATLATVHVHELLDHSLRLLHHQILGKRVSLQRHYNAQADAVCGDDAQLQQAFMNLLLNALEAMDRNGVLTVATDINQDDSGRRLVQIRVQDTGVGIPPENVGRLFEPFFTTKKNGTGLGMAICRRIAHEHQGDIRAESEPNRGATFSFSLPLIAS